MASKTFQRSEMEQEAKDIGEATFGPAFLAAAASVGLSWYLWSREEIHLALFVGLWPPTILAFSNYVRQRQIMRSVDRLTSPGESVRETIGSVIG